MAKCPKFWPKCAEDLVNDDDESLLLLLLLMNVGLLELPDD